MKKARTVQTEPHGLCCSTHPVPGYFPTLNTLTTGRSIYVSNVVRCMSTSAENHSSVRLRKDSGLRSLSAVPPTSFDGRYPDTREIGWDLESGIIEMDIR